MSGPRYQIQFVGGPVDGAVVSVKAFSFNDTLLMPTSSVTVPPLLDTWRLIAIGRRGSVYQMTSNCRRIDGGREIVDCRYDFLRFENTTVVQHGNRMAPVRRRWIVAVTHWICRARDHAVAWMLTPVDHPLQIAQR